MTRRFMIAALSAAHAFCSVATTVLSWGLALLGAAPEPSRQSMIVSIVPGRRRREGRS